MDYTYNKNALKEIRKAYGMKRGYIPSQTGIPVNTYKAWEDGGMIKIEDLIVICNYLRIGLDAFLKTEGSDDIVIPERHERAGFVPTILFPDVMEEYLTKELKQPVATVCDKVNMSPRGWYLYFPREDSKKSSLQADKFFKICNVFKIYPGSFMTGLGASMVKYEGYNEALVVRSMGDMRLMNQSEKEILEMKNTLAIATQSSDPIGELRKKYDSVLEDKLRIQKEKHERSYNRMKKQIEKLTAQVKEQELIIKDLRQQLKEARFYSDNMTYGMRAAEEN